MLASHTEAVSIIGAACRFPGAPSLLDYFRLLLAGTSAIGLPGAARASELKLRQHAAAGYLDSSPYGFDFRTFHMTAEEARRADPQHRLLLELTWEALEDAGILVDATKGANVGVFVGMTWSDHLLRETRAASTPSGYAAVGNLKTFAANRISYFFDWRGPSFALDAACASSLVALHQACIALRAGECELAVVAASELILDAASTEMMAATGVLSAEEVSRPLDARADGFVRGEGGAVIVLRLRKHVRGHELRYADVLSSAVSHNGRSALLMRSSSEALFGAIAEAWTRAGVGKDDIDYVELHGTGTRQGDDAELEALARAFHGRAASACAIGSVKSNLGNLGAASGLASLLKVIGCMQLGVIVPTLAVESVCNALRDAEPLVAQRVLGEWPSVAGRPRRAGVNASSFGGCNVHVVIQASVPSALGPLDPPDVSAAPNFLALSAPNRAALRALVEAYCRLLHADERSRAFDLASVYETALFARTHLDVRCAIVADSKAHLSNGLARWLACEDPVIVELSEGASDAGLAAAREFVTSRSRSYQPHGTRRELATLPPRRWKRSELKPAQSNMAAVADVSELERALLAAPSRLQQQRLLADWIALEIAQHTDEPQVDRRRGLFELGLNSVAWIGILTKLSHFLDVQLPRILPFEAVSVDALADAVLERRLSQRGPSTAREPSREVALGAPNSRPQSTPRPDALESELRTLLDELDHTLEART